MPKTRCECGAKYRFPETSIGNRARCKRCGAIYTLEPQVEDDGAIPLEDDSEMLRDTGPAAHEASSAAVHKARCECGAKYRFSEESIGKRTKCKKCGAIFRLEPQDEEGPIPVADDNEMSEEMAPAVQEAAFATVHKARCECGAKYKFPETSMGKRTRCKKCGAIFTLQPQDDEGPIPLADDSEMQEEMAAAAREATFGAAPKQGEVFMPSSSPAAAASMGLGSAPAVATGSAIGRGFGGDVLWTFLFPSSPGNLITFFCFWIAMVIGPMVTCIPLIGIFLWFAVLGWYYAYLFEVLGAAAGGERDLPEMPSPRHLVDVFDPLFKWVGSWIFVFIPALAYIILTWRQSGLTGYDLLPIMANGLAGLLGGQGSGTAVFDILVYVGIIFWPMVVLCVALGGFASLYRLDLILWTIIKTLPLYLLLLGLMLGAVFMQQGFMTLAGGSLASQAQSGQGSATSMLGFAFVLGILGTGIEVYMDIVLMRLIGFYYYHFKERFAFSWG